MKHASHCVAMAMTGCLGYPHCYCIRHKLAVMHFPTKPESECHYNVSTDNWAVYHTVKEPEVSTSETNNWGSSFYSFCQFCSHQYSILIMSSGSQIVSGYDNIIQLRSHKDHISKQLWALAQTSELSASPHAHTGKQTCSTCTPIAEHCTHCTTHTAPYTHTHM